jgi:hypothetical protein
MDTLANCVIHILHMDLKDQHKAAVRLLKRLGLKTIRLELRDGRYTYVGWNNPAPGNGYLRLKSGRVKA